MRQKRLVFLRKGSSKAKRIEAKLMASMESRFRSAMGESSSAGGYRVLQRQERWRKVKKVRESTWDNKLKGGQGAESRHYRYTFKRFCSYEKQLSRQLE